MIDFVRIARAKNITKGYLSFLIKMLVIRFVALATRRIKVKSYRPKLKARAYSSSMSPCPMPFVKLFIVTNRLGKTNDEI